MYLTIAIRYYILVYLHMKRGPGIWLQAVPAVNSFTSSCPLVIRSSSTIMPSLNRNALLFFVVSLSHTHNAETSRPKTHYHFLMILRHVENITAARKPAYPSRWKSKQNKNYHGAMMCSQLSGIMAAQIWRNHSRIGSCYGSRWLIENSASRRQCVQIPARCTKQTGRRGEDEKGKRRHSAFIVNDAFNNLFEKNQSPRGGKHKADIFSQSRADTNFN